MSEKLLIDMDVVCFKAAAACETRSIDVKHIPSGKVKNFKNRTEFKKWLEDNTKWEATAFEITDKQEHEPIEFCCHTVKQMIKNYQQVTGIEDCAFYISGTGNFRLDLQLPTRYKSNRKDLLKPVLLPQVRDWVLRKYNPIIANGKEADDLLQRDSEAAIRRGDKWVIVTVDKDARQSGWTFNPDQDVAPVCNEGLGKLYRDKDGNVKGNGYLWLCFQWMFADKADNYCALDIYKLFNTKFKFGEVGIYKLLVDCKSIDECNEAVDKFFNHYYPTPVEYQDWAGRVVKKDWKEIRDMYWACAKMSPFDNGEQQ